MLSYEFQFAQVSKGKSLGFRAVCAILGLHLLLITGLSVSHTCSLWNRKAIQEKVVFLEVCQSNIKADFKLSSTKA